MGEHYISSHPQCDFSRFYFFNPPNVSSWIPPAAVLYSTTPKIIYCLKAWMMRFGCLCIVNILKCVVIWILCFSDAVRPRAADTDVGICHLSGALIMLEVRHWCRSVLPIIIIIVSNRLIHAIPIATEALQIWQELIDTLVESNHECVWTSQSSGCVLLVCLSGCLTKHSEWVCFPWYGVQTNKNKTLASSHAVSQILHWIQESCLVLPVLGGPEKMGGGGFLSSVDRQKYKQWHHIRGRLVQSRHV